MVRINVELHNGTLVVAVEGRIDGANAMQFQRAVHDALGEDKGPLLIDCGMLSYISSAGLRAFLSIAKLLHRREGKFAICALSNMIAQIFQISGFDRIISVHATREEALSEVGERRPNLIALEPAAG